MRRRSIREARGSVIAEAALVLPLMFTILLGIFWVGRGFNTYEVMLHAAREGARIAATATCATCGNIGYGVDSGGADIVASSYVAPILQASGVNLKLVTAPAVATGLCTCAQINCTPPACSRSSGQPQILVCPNVDMGIPSYTPAVCGTAVMFQFPYSLPLPFAPASVQTVTLTARALARTEQ
ncbi:MAG: pilus assembly protein [Acidobacteriales bacterium]|nr:pilus assembly protein [Terriglobales bacterium]